MRGKPVSVTDGVPSLFWSFELYFRSGLTAARDNYGDPWGLPSARLLLQSYRRTKDQVIVNGSSSLNLMHDIISHAVTHGLAGQPSWAEQMASKGPGTTLKFPVLLQAMTAILLHSMDLKTLLYLMIEDIQRWMWSFTVTIISYEFVNPVGSHRSD